MGTDRAALESLSEKYPTARPFINAIFQFRESSKMASVFLRGLEPGTGNLRCNFSPSGTETGRLSSQQNPYGRGTNAQNLTDRVRSVVEAPDGYAILNLDLKTAESIAVGYISQDRGYIDACLSGDLHTSVSKMNWRDLPWTGVLKQDKQIAEQPFYRELSYRDMAKKGGHGTNYYGTPRTMAGHMKIDWKVVDAFQLGYFAAFPGIQLWHLDVIARIQREGLIVTQLGRERRFWGRSEDAATHREAIAFNPQSLVADVMNEGLLQVQDWIIRQAREVIIPGNGGRLKRIMPSADLRAQVHDAGVFLVPIDGAAEIALEIQKRLVYPVDFGSLGVMSIPSDIMIGKRWGKRKIDRKTGKVKVPDGLADWTPGTPLHFS